MWRSRKSWLAVSLCTMTLLMTCLTMVRHRHAGDRIHSHMDGRIRSRPHSHTHHHGHPHSHTHRHAHTHAHPHEPAASVEMHHGWHLHLLLLGWEITIWERGVEIVRVPREDHESSPGTTTGATASSGPEWLTTGGSSWHLLSFVVPLLLPMRRVELPIGELSAAVSENSASHACRRERPPVPPPRLTEMPTLRR